MRYKRIFLHVVGAVAGFYTFNLLLMDIILTRANEKTEINGKNVRCWCFVFPLRNYTTSIEQTNSRTWSTYIYKKERKKTSTDSYLQYSFFLSIYILNENFLRLAILIHIFLFIIELRGFLSQWCFEIWLLSAYLIQKRKSFFFISR